MPCGSLFDANLQKCDVKASLSNILSSPYIGRALALRLILAVYMCKLAVLPNYHDQLLLFSLILYRSPDSCCSVPMVPLSISVYIYTMNQKRLMCDERAVRRK